MAGWPELLRKQQQDYANQGIGHLAHFHWREKDGTPEGRGPWWQLYTEGFAQRCEHLILGEETWHMRGRDDDDWVEWCRDHTGWLATQSLKAVEAGASVRPFFGSWYDIQGRRQCGYYLGHALIRRLEGNLSLREGESGRSGQGA